MASDVTSYMTYRANLVPDARKKKLLNDTYAFYRKGEELFFDAFFDILGGVSPQLINTLVNDGTIKAENDATDEEKNDITEEDKNNTSKKKLDPKLLCAILWFRLVKKEKNTCEILNVKLLKEKFSAYYGAEANDTVISYFSANYDVENYMWVDCRVRCLSFCNKLGTSLDVLAIDLESMLRAKNIAFFGGVGKADKAISNIFIRSEKRGKSNVKKLHEYAVNTIDILEKTEVINSDQYLDVLLRVFGAANIDELQNICKKENGGSKLVKPIGQFLNSKFVFDPKKVKKSWVDLAKEKSYAPNYPSCDKLKIYIENKLGKLGQLTKPKNKVSDDDEQGSNKGLWSSMFRNAITSICAAVTHNYSFSIGQTDRQEKLSILRKSNGSIANEINENFPQKDQYTIMPYHVPDLKNTIRLYNGLNQKTDEEIAGILNTINNNEKAKRKKHGDVRAQAYILSLYTSNSTKYTEKSITDALKINKIEDTIKNQKVHPFVLGNAGMRFGGDDNCVGRIERPSVFVKELGCYAGESDKMWITIKVIDEGRWKTHHIPFFQAKYYEELYAFDPDPEKKETVNIRMNKTNTLAKKGNTSNAGMFNESFYEGNDEETKMKRKKYRQKRVRNKVALENLKYNVDFVDPTFVLFKNSEGFGINISQNIQDPTGLKGEITTGQNIMGIDQNRDRSNSYSIWRITGDQANGIYPAEFVKSGDISSLIKTNKKDEKGNKKEYDVFTYDGLNTDSEKLNSFFADRKAFIYGLDPAVFNTSEYNIFFEYEKIKNEKKKIYQWNGSYLSLLRKVLTMSKGNTEKLKNEIRKEIINVIRLIDGKSSLSHCCIMNMQGMIKVINSWFAYTMGENSSTEDQKKEYDSEMYNLLLYVRKRRKNKKTEKINKMANAIICTAIENNVKHIILEALDKKGDKGNSRQNNASNMDWCAKGIIDKVITGCRFVDINVRKVNPAYTSHQDPMVHNKNNPAMKPRIAKIDMVEKNNWAVEKLVSISSMDPKENSAEIHYFNFIDVFCRQYKIDRKDLNKIKKISDLQDLMAEKHSFIYVPSRGGQYYLSTHRVTSCDDDIQILYDGKNVWLANSDHIAAANIVLRGLDYSPSPKKKNKTDLDLAAVGG